LKSKEAALHFMDAKILPEDEVGVLSYSIPQGLTVHEFLTTDHKKAREVIEGFGAKNIAGRAYNVESNYWRTMGEEKTEYPRADFDSGWSTLARAVYKEHASRFSLKMIELSKALRYVPGYKHILFFSSGIAGSVMHDKPSSIENIRARKMTMIRE